MVNYQQAKIYLIQLINSVNATVYIGSTTSSLSVRMGNHRSTARNRPDVTAPIYEAMREHGVETFRIILVKNFPCNSKEELEAEEYKELNRIKAAGVGVYNRITADGVAEETKKKLAANSPHRGRFAAESVAFRFGSIGQYDGALRFSWVEQEKIRSKRWSIKKYGYLGAYSQAIALRKSTYPDWKTPEEEAAEELGRIEY